MSPAGRAGAVAAALPGAVLSGWAAAHLLGVADMDGRTPDGRELPVMVCPGRSGRFRPRSGITLLRSPLGPGDVVEVAGLAVTSPVRTAFDLARTAGDLWRAVEEVDCVVRGRDPALLGALARYAADRPGWTGVGIARRAAAAASVHTLSRGESWVRMVWTEMARLPPPLLNVPVHDHDGHHLGTPDLLDPDLGLVGEYDGAGHRSAHQQHADAVRAELLVGAGLVLVRISAVDRRSPRATAHRLLAGAAVAGRSTHRGWLLPGGSAS